MTERDYKQNATIVKLRPKWCQWSNALRMRMVPK